MQKWILCFFIGMISTAFSWTVKTGTYDLYGYNTSGVSTYQGEVVIAPQGDNYSVLWRIGSGQTQVGIGIMRDWDSVFSVAFADLSNSYWGVTSYKVGAFGEIEGKWSFSTGTSQGTEILYWKSPSIY